MLRARRRSRVLRSRTATRCRRTGEPTAADRASGSRGLTTPPTPSERPSSPHSHRRAYGSPSARCSTSWSSRSRPAREPLVRDVLDQLHDRRRRQHGRPVERAPEARQAVRRNAPALPSGPTRTPGACEVNTSFGLSTAAQTIPVTLRRQCRSRKPADPAASKNGCPGVRSRSSPEMVNAMKATVLPRCSRPTGRHRWTPVEQG